MRPSWLPSEWVLVGALLWIACAITLADTLFDLGAIAPFRITSWLFLLITASYCGHKLCRSTGTVSLWTLFCLFSVAFFSATGVLGSTEGPLYDSGRRYVQLAIEAMILLAAGLAGSLAAYEVVRAGFHCSLGAGAEFLRLRRVRLPIAVGLIGTAWALRAFAAREGFVLSWAMDVMSSVNRWTSLLIHLSFLLRPLIIFLSAALATDASPARRQLGIISLVGEAGYSVLMGRRDLLEMLAYLTLTAIWLGKRLDKRKLIALSAAIGILFFVLWPAVFHLRMVARGVGLFEATVGDRASILMTEVIPEAARTFTLSEAFARDSSYRENIHYRVHDVDFLVEIEAAHENGREFMWGKGLATALVATVPRIIWRGKERLLEQETWQVEQVIQSHFGLPLVDSGSTILTQAYADGGLIGILAYMALMGGTFALCELQLRTSRSKLIGVWMFALGASLAIQIEADITRLFAVWRVLGVLWAVDCLAGHIIERRSMHAMAFASRAGVA